MLPQAKKSVMYENSRLAAQIRLYSCLSKTKPTRRIAAEQQNEEQRIMNQPNVVQQSGNVSDSNGENAMPASFLSRHWQKLAAAALWLAMIGGAYAYINANNLSLGEALQQLIRLMQTPIGPLIYLLLYAIRPLLFFSAVVLTVSAGAIFGPVLGVIYTVIAANISATIAYLLGRFFGNDVIDESKTEGLVQSYAGRMRRNSFETILIMRFIFLPYDLVNYLAGFLKIRYTPFILATILGSIPGTVTFVLAGAAVSLDSILVGDFRPEFNLWSLFASAVIFVASLAFSRYLKQREARRTAAAANENEAPVIG
jgi:uncharacterized membrane protein YdjX (TVP38/TMEM64 family)